MIFTLKDENYLRDLIEGVIINDEYWIGNLYKHFYPLINRTYRNFIGRKYGNLYEEDIENECLQRMIQFMTSFNGTTWREFNSYNVKIIKSTFINFKRDKIGKNKVSIPIYYDSEQNRQFLEYQYNYFHSMEDEILEKITFCELIKNIFTKLTEKEKTLLWVINNYEDLKVYAEQKKCSYKALKQAKYRLKIKIINLPEFRDYLARS